MDGGRAASNNIYVEKTIVDSLLVICIFTLHLYKLEKVINIPIGPEKFVERIAVKNILSRMKRDWNSSFNYSAHLNALSSI